MILNSLFLATTVGLSPLHIKDTQFVDAKGNVVRLRGVNLGGWLVEETWMTPVHEDPPAGSKLPISKDHKSLWGTIEKRLGTAAMLRVRTAWRENWIQPLDFDRIKAAGLNHVRLPFLSSLFDEPQGIDWIRKAVKLAKERGLYVVLDMHGAPGSQSNEHHTGERDHNRFWFEPKNIVRAEAIWKMLAKEFGKDPTVAAYDMLNEPTGTPNVATLHLVYNRLISAIRSVDPIKPVIVDDAYRGFDTTPHPDAAGWTQVAYSLHRYNFDAKETADHFNVLKKDLPKMLELQGYRNSPIYVGEFNLEPHGSPTAIVDYAHELDAAKFSWAAWTFKTVNPSGPMGVWGLYSNPGKVDPIDPFLDSEAVMIQKLKQVRTERLKPISPNLKF